MTAPTEAKVCAVCARVLSLYESPEGDQSWVHGLQDDDHRPVPVDPDEVPVEGRCDFCNMDAPTWNLPVRPFRMPYVRSLQEALDEDNAPIQMSGGDWSACDTCARYLELNQWNSILKRAVAKWERDKGTKMPTVVRQSLAGMHRTVRKHVSGSLHPLEPSKAPEGSEEAPRVTEWGQNRPGNQR